jgi:uncharacterized membrane protein
MLIKETKKRTIFKTITWRMVAIVNSWMVLVFVQDPHTNLAKALIMNITGFIVFYFFERIWTKIKYGRIIINEKDEQQ